MLSVPDADHRPHRGDPARREAAAARHASASGHRPGRCDYDAELRLHTEVLRRAWAIRPSDHVLDIGCGSGQTTRQAARLARAGSAVGIDISAPAIARARELAWAEGLHNVTFERADAQTHRFAVECFDLVISRFGTMFFDDPDLAEYWAQRRRKVKPPLDSYTVHLLTRQDGRCTLCGENLLTPDQPPQTPEGWEWWFLWVTKKAIKADDLVHHTARHLETR